MQSSVKIRLSSAFFLTAASLALVAGSTIAQQPNVGNAPTQPAAKPAAQPATQPAAKPTPTKVDPSQMRQLSPEEVAKMKAAQAGGKTEGDDVDATKKEAVDPANPAGQIVFTKQTAELGGISDDKSVDFEFPFTNEGNSTLEFLGQPQGSCGCTVPTLEKLTYAPGESGVIKGTYNPNHRNGPQHTQITVRTNDPKKPTLKLHVKSDVRPIFRVDPQFLNVGQVDRKTGATTSFKVISRREDIKVTQVTPPSARVKANVGTTEAKQLESGETVWETPVEVIVDGTAGVGQLNENIVIRSSDSARTLSTVVIGEVLGDLTLSPNQLSLPGLTPGQPVSSEFIVTSRNGQPFKVLKVEEVAQGGAQPFMTFEASEVQGATPPQYKVKIAGTAPAAQGALRGEIVVTTDNANDPQMRLRYFGFVRPQPAQPQPVAQDPWKANPSLLEQPK